MQIYFTTFRYLAMPQVCNVLMTQIQSNLTGLAKQEFEWGQTIPERGAICGPEVRNSPSEQGLHQNNIKIPTTAETISNEEPVHGAPLERVQTWARALN